MDVRAKLDELTNAYGGRWTSCARTKMRNGRIVHVMVPVQWPELADGEHVDTMNAKVVWDMQTKAYAIRAEVRESGFYRLEDHEVDHA